MAGLDLLIMTLGEVALLLEMPLGVELRAGRELSIDEEEGVVIIARSGVVEGEVEDAGEGI